MPTIKSIDGEEIYYEVMGEGKVTLIPIAGLGAPSGREIWKYQLPLTNKYKFVLIDPASYGKSTCNRQEYTMELFGQDIKTVVEYLDLKNIILIGQSMGGPIIAEAERLLSDRTLGLIAADTFLVSEPYAPDEETATQMTKSFQDNFVDTWLNLVESLISEKMKPEDAEGFRKGTHDLDPRSITNSYKHFLLWDQRRVLPHISKPIKAIIAGKTVQKQEERDQYTARFDTVLLEDIGHVMMYEDPDGFNLTLEKRIKDIVSVNPPK